MGKMKEYCTTGKEYSMSECDFYQDAHSEIDCCPDHSAGEEMWIQEIYENVHEVFCEDPTVVGVMRLMEKRSQEGMQKYGMSMANNPLALKQWLQHALEESMDQSLYLYRAIQEIDNIIKMKQDGCVVTGVCNGV